MKKLLLALLLLPVIGFSQNINVAKQGAAYQLRQELGGGKFDKYLGLPLLDSAYWGTINGVRQYSDLYRRKSDTALMVHDFRTGADNVMTSGDVLNVASFGLRNDSLSSSGIFNQAAINNAISTAKSGQKIYIPYGNYFFATVIAIPSTKDIYLVSDGNLYFPNGYGINIENAWQNKVRIESNGTIYGQNTGTNYDSYTNGCGVRISNSYDNVYKFNKIQGFYTAVQIGGKGSVFNGSQYNKVTFENLFRNNTGLLLKCEGTVALWCNQNTFTGGKISGKYGVWMDSISVQSDPFNGNQFYNIGYEAVTGSAILMEHAKHNTFYSNRASEAENPSSTAVISMAVSCENNEFYGGTYYESAIKDLGFQNDFYRAIYTASGVKLGSMLLGKTSTTAKGIVIGDKLSASGLSETVNNVWSYYSRNQKYHAALAKVDSIEKAIPYLQANVLVTSTEQRLPENPGIVRYNPSANGILYYRTGDINSSVNGFKFYVQNITAFSATIKSGDSVSTLATVTGEGIWEIWYSFGNWTAYRTGGAGSTPFTNNGNAFGSNAILGTTDAFDLFIRTAAGNQMRFYQAGNFGPVGSAAIRNDAALNNAYIQLLTTGTQVWRNIADANPAIQINQNNASSTGDIIDGRKAGAKVFSVNSTGVVTTPQYRLSALNTAPASATDTGTTGEIRITSGFIFICIATNTWVRAALSTF